VHWTFDRPAEVAPTAVPRAIGDFGAPSARWMVTKRRLVMPAEALAGPMVH
jgi:hypothetical protein